MAQTTAPRPAGEDTEALPAKDKWMDMDTKPAGLQALGITPEEAADLPRGVRKSVASYLVRYGHHEQARDLLLRIAAEDPTGMLYRTWLIHALLGCGDTAEADRLSREILNDFPDKQRVLTARGCVLFALDDQEAAREVFARFTSSPENAYSYWGWLGALAQQRGEWDVAGSALSRALGIYERNRAEREEDEYAVPLYLWSALAAQAVHEGRDPGSFAGEIEEIRAKEETALRGALADSRTRAQTPAAPRPRRRDRAADEPSPDELAAEPIAPPLPCGPNPELEAQLKHHFGFAQFRPGQQQVVEAVLAGRSVLAVMPTGGGKSLCYQLPAMLMDGLTLVISPLIALMKDQVDGLPASVQQQATLLNSSLESDEIERRLREIGAGRYKMVYAAPERLRQRPFLHALRRRGVSLLVVDEAHCVSMWGHDFRPDYLFIGDALRYLGETAVLAMTATATPKMRVEIANHLGQDLKVVSTGTHRPNLILESVVVRTDEDKLREVIKLCREIDGPGIIYTRSRRKTEELARILRRERVHAAFYHAGMGAEERTRTQEEFMDGRWRVVCATVAFGMGIDKRDVRFVIHYSLPEALEDYYQEAGRAGRDGFPSRCILLCTPSDKALVTRWMREERIDIDLPRRCYQMIREFTSDSPYAVAPVDDFERELQVDETRVRVAISMLEEVGMAKRHLDVPTTMTIHLTAKGAAQGASELAEFARNARLKVDQRISFDTLELSERGRVPPPEIEEKLLEWRADGFIGYHGSGRVMLLERLPAPRESKRLLEDLLSRYARVQEERVEKACRYAETSRCRHDMIARHFGEPGIESCCSCDNCTPQKQPGERISRQARPVEAPLTDEEKRHKILETVRMVPGQVGFTGLVRVLKGSVASHIKRDRCPNFGVFAAEPKATIERYVGELLEEGYLRRDDSEFRLISLGSKASE